MSHGHGFAAQLAEDLSREDMESLLALLRADVARLTGVMQEAIRTGDEASFRHAAHGMAGAAGAVGADALEQASRAAMTRPELRAHMAGCLATIAHLAAAAIAEIEAVLAAGASA